jgi:hypothetical protein
LNRKEEKAYQGFKYDYGTSDAAQDTIQRNAEEEEEQELIKDILLFQLVANNDATVSFPY